MQLDSLVLKDFFHFISRPY